MHPCSNCGKPTTNPKYCSRHCAGSARPSQAARQKMSKHMKQRYANGFKPSSTRPEIAAKISQALIGREITWMKGKTYEQIYGSDKAQKLKNQRREQAKANPPAAKYTGRTYEQIYGPERAAEIKKKISDARKGIPSPSKGKTYDELYGPKKAEQLRQAKREAATGCSFTQDRLDNMRKAQFALWRDPEHAEMMRQARRSKPNGAELQLLILLKDNKLHFKYVGDFQLNLGGKFPDFAHAEKPLLIELFGEPWHEPEEEQERIDYFTNFGYRTLVVWSGELQDPHTLIERVTRFTAT